MTRKQTLHENQMEMGCRREPYGVWCRVPSR